MQEKVKLIFQQVEKDEAFKRMFFKKLSETENPTAWFEELQIRGYLDPSNNKNPIFEGNNYTVPYWGALDYLENLARRATEKPEENILERLLIVINSIINYREKDQRIENPHTDWMIIKTIFKLPINRITEDHIKFIEIALMSKFSNSVLISAEIEKTVFPYLVEKECKNLLLELLRVVIKPRIGKEPYSFFEKSSIMDEFWFSETIKKFAKKLVEICGLDIARIVIDQITSILRDEEKSFNVVSIPTIEDSSQNLFPEKYECQLVYLLRTTLEKTDTPLRADFLNELLQSQFPIFKRIGIHTINYHYQKYGNFFWSWKGNPLEEIELKHEIYQLLTSNNQSFSEAEFDKLIDWIETIKLRSSKNTTEEVDLSKEEAYVKLEWLSAVVNADNRRVKELHSKYFQIYPVEIEHPGYLFWSSGVQVSQRTAAKPFSDDLLNQPNQKIAEYIINYKEPEERKIFELGEELKYSFSRTVREHPKKFVTEMKPFLALKFEYQEALLSGILEGWKNNEQFSWDDLFDYITALISEARFWAQEEKTEAMDRRFLIGRIADLIYEGTNDDRHAFDQRCLPQCEKILLILSENTPSDVDDSSKDIFTAVLNSALGRVYYAIISYSLRFARIYRKDVDQKWIDPIRTHFEKVLHKGRSVEFNVILGTFLLQLYYLDKNWTKESINIIFPKEDIESWTIVFSSYLFHSSQFSKELYLLLRENQHYTSAIRTEPNGSTSFAKLSQHICIAYFNDLEPLSDGSLISELITSENINYLSDLIHFVWRLGDKIDAGMKTKIKPLWDKIIAFIKNSEDESKYGDILAYLSFWLSLVDRIDDDICSWLKISVKYIDARTEMFFIEYLLAHVTTTPKLVAEIFYELVSSQRYLPYHQSKNISAIVKQLFVLGQTEKAKRICSLYLKNGHQFLRGIFEEYKDS
jgi:hypothetical protein